MEIRRQIIYPLIFVAFLVIIAVAIAGATSVPEGKVKPVDISEGLQMPLMSLAITLTLDKDRIL